MVARHKPVQPTQNQLLVLQKKEHQQRHQNQINGYGDDAYAGRQRPGQGILTDIEHFGSKSVDRAQHLSLGDQFWIHFWQAEQQLLTCDDHDGQLLHQLGQLPGNQRQQPKQQDQHKSSEQHEHHARRQQSRQPKVALQDLHDAFQQVSDHDAGQHRGQVLAHDQDDAGAQHQHDGQNDRLGIVEKPLKPVADNLHEMPWRVARSRCARW